MLEIARRRSDGPSQGRDVSASRFPPRFGKPEGAKAPGPASTLRIAREGGWVAGGQIAGVIGSAVGIRVLTHLLDPQSFGEVALGLTAATLASQVVFGPVAGAAIRFLPISREADSTGIFTRSLQRLTLRATALVAVVGVIAGGGAIVFIGSSAAVLALATALLSILTGWDAVASGIQTAARRRLIVVWHQVLAQWLRPVVVLAVAAIRAPASSTVMAAFAAVYVIVVISQVLLLRRTEFRETKQRTLSVADIRSIESQMTHYAAPIAAFGLFTWLQIASDRWALQAFADPVQLGLYAVLVQLAYQPFTLIGGALTQFVAPVVFARAGGGGDPKRLLSALRLNAYIAAALLVLTCGAVVIALLLHRAVFEIVVAPQYRVVSWMLAYVVAAAGLANVGQLLTITHLGALKTRMLLRPKIMTALLGLALNFAGAFYFGVLGVVVALLVFGAAFCGWMIGMTVSEMRRLSDLRPGSSEADRTTLACRP